MRDWKNTAGLREPRSKRTCADGVEFIKKIFFAKLKILGFKTKNSFVDRDVGQPGNAAADEKGRRLKQKHAV